MCGLWHTDEIEQVICTPSKRRYCGKYITIKFFYAKIITILERVRLGESKRKMENVGQSNLLPECF